MLNDSGHLTGQHGKGDCRCLTPLLSDLYNNPRGGGYSHIRAAWVCATRKTPFLTWATPKDSTFSTWTAPKDPLFKDIHLFVFFHFSALGCSKRPFLKKYSGLLFLVPIPPPPRFSVRGRSEHAESSPYSAVKGRSLSPPPRNFKLWAAHIIWWKTIRGLLPRS